MAQSWFYQIGEGQQSGPVDSRGLRRLVEAGIVTPNTLVRRGAGGHCVRAESVRGLFERSTPAPSPSPIASEPTPIDAPGSDSRSESDSTLGNQMRYVLAVVACGLELFAYAVIGVQLGWRHGGGLIPMLIFFWICRATWSAITKYGEQKDDAIADAAPPLRPVPAVVSEPETKKGAEAAPSAPSRSLGASPPGPSPVPESGAPSRGDTPGNPWSARNLLMAGIGVFLVALAGVATREFTRALLQDGQSPPRGQQRSFLPGPEGDGTSAGLELADRSASLDAPHRPPDGTNEFERVAIPEGWEVIEQLSASDLYKRASPSSIRVENYDRHGKLAASGSGFLVSPVGQVVTNLHVIRGADTVTVRLSSGATTAVRGVLCLDEAHDLAVLDIGGSAHDYLQLSKATPAVGTRVYAIGNPLGFDGTLSEGIVSGWPQLDGVLYIQTTAPISPGSSGGPLLAADGTVIGITTASLRGGQNLNLAVPASAISGLLNERQELLTLAQVNARIGAENHQITTEDDPVKLAAVWDAIRANESGDALRMLAQIPSARRGTGYWIASGHLHFRLRNLSEAQAAFGEAVAIDPNNAESLLRLALALRFDDSQRSWDTPIDLCERVIQLDPTNVPAHVIRGLCATSNEEEIGYFKTAVALAPKDFAAQYGLGIASLGKAGNPEDAVKALEIALEIEKRIDLDDYLIRDRLLSPASELTRIPTTSSLHVPIKLALAMAYRESDEHELAVQECKDVLALEPNNPVATWGLCLTYQGWRGFDDADALYWKRRTNEEYILVGVSPRLNMPEVVYFGMLR